MENLKKELDYSLSDDDIKNHLGQDTKILKYADLNNYKTLDELLPKEKDYVVILIETKRNNGHWTTLIKNNNQIEYFDSYGLDIDKEFGFISSVMKRMLGESKNQLGTLVDDSNYDVIYNNKQLQSHKDFVSTCGRHVVSRILNFKKGMGLKDYIDYLDFFKKTK